MLTLLFYYKVIPINALAYSALYCMYSTYLRQYLTSDFDKKRTLRFFLLKESFRSYTICER